MSKAGLAAACCAGVSAFGAGTGSGFTDAAAGGAGSDFATAGGRAD